MASVITQNSRKYTGVFFNRKKKMKNFVYNTTMFNVKDCK